MAGKRSTSSNGSGLAAVAQRAGVSLATASRVLAGSTHRVSGDLRDRVLRAAEMLDYVPNASARSLISGMRRVVGVLMHDTVDSKTHEYIRAIEEVADREGWLIMLVNASRDVGKEFRYLRMFREERVGAIILVGSGLDDEHYRTTLTRELGGYVTQGGRVAFTGRHGLPFTEFVPDNIEGALSACEHLLRYGHRRIGIITGPQTITSTQDRLIGAKRAFAAAGVPWNPELVAEADFRRAGGALACAHLLARAPDLTGIFAMSDDMAFGVYDVAHARGFNVPSDLSVVGFDDVAMSRDVDPPLTTINYSTTELARRAIEACVGHAKLETAQVVIPCELIVRKSAASPKER